MKYVHDILPKKIFVMKKIIQQIRPVVQVSVFGLIVVLLNFSVALALENNGTTIKRNADGCTVDIIIQLAVDGTPADVTKIKTALTNKLESLDFTIPCPPLTTGCCHIKFTTVVQLKSSIPAGDQGKYHQIKIVGAEETSCVQRPPSGWYGNGVTTTGRFRVNANDEVITHEVLHLCGLHDLYCRITRLKPGAGPGSILHYPVCSPPTACCGVGPNAGDQCTADCPGHTNDIMCNQTAGIVVSEVNVDSIVMKAGLFFCPDPPCCLHTITIPSATTPSINTAITTLNTSGVPAGGIIFNIDANYTETGVNLILNTTTSSATSPVVFRKNPDQAGANPKLIVAAGSSGATDGGIIIAGTDYVTFDQVDIDASAQTTIEWGYALVKRQNVAPFDGCQHTAIKGCCITLNKTNTNETSGIYSGNHTATSTTALTITAPSDACNFTRIDNNRISNVHNGVKLFGYSVPSGGNYALFDHNNEIGKYGTNVISNFSSPTIECYGVIAYYQDSITVMNDSITSGSGSLKRMTGIALNASVGSSNAEVAYNNISVSSSASGLVNLYGIWNNLGTPPGLNCVNIHDNNIYNCSYLTATNSPMYGILNTARPDTMRIMNNHIHDFTYAGTSTFYLVSSSASITVQNIGNNEIENITSTGTASVHMIYTGQAGTSNVFSNRLHDMAANGLIVAGISAVSGTNWNIYKNRIYNISSASTSAVVNGINNTGAATATIYNNFISDLRAPSSLSNPALNGMSLTGGTSTNVYYNTIYLDQAVPGGASFGSCAIYCGTTPTMTLKDNILVNVSAHGLTGYTVAHRRNGPTLTTYSATSDYNDFYAGPPGPNNLIFYDGTSVFMTVPAYQAFVAPRDAASFTENPPFLNTFGTPYDLHMHPGINTLCESGGGIVSSPVNIVADYDNDPRYPNTGYPYYPCHAATAPDVGADEFAGGQAIQKSLNLSAVLEGLYSGGGLMTPSYNCDGLQFQADTADIITVELHNSLNYAIVEHSIPAALMTSGTIATSIPCEINGSYYLTIRHRNSLETTSAVPVNFSGATVSYTFGTPVQAYGSNMGLLMDGTAVIYGGDENQDGLVDGSDLSDVENLASIAACGYLPQDINGDGLIDGTDLSIAGNNAALAIGTVTP
jgi:hypothetical protein